MDLDAGLADTGGSNFPTLADYRTCRTNTDCPVGLGECIKTIAYNRPDLDGVSTATIADIFVGIGRGEGVCSRVCTLDQDACETLTLRNGAGEPVPFTCQVVATGTISYPDWSPPFPFDDRIDFSEQERGRPFAAMCRPPFGLDPIHSNNFCAPCDVNSACDGVCYRFDTESVVTTAGAPGLCLGLAPPSGCPRGFAARTVEGNVAICVPEMGTCGPCQDRDGDGHGAGHCTEVEIDCDDTNPNAYYSITDPEHPFPTYCGGFDYNCNGESDETEQVGVETYREFHCEYCGDDAHGRTVQVGTAAQATLECVRGVVRTSTCAGGALRAHCDGDVRLVGGVHRPRQHSHHDERRRERRSGGPWRCGGPWRLGVHPSMLRRWRWR